MILLSSKADPRTAEYLKTKDEVRQYSYQDYVQNPIEQAPVIQGYFYKQVSRKSMAIRKIITEENPILRKISKEVKVFS